MRDTIIKIEHVSKKFCRRLTHTMLYGVADITRSTLGLAPRSERLRSGEFWAVDDVSFEVKQGETIGIIGPNGAGKTTILKMLNGIFMPDKGEISIKGRVGALIEVGAGFHPMLTGRENIYINGAILGMSKKEINKKFDSIVAFADIGDFLDSPVKYYSSGMYVRLGFAVAAYSEPDVLLVDEVLAVGDEGFQTKCFNKIGELKKDGAMVVLVAHNMHIIGTFSEKVLLLEHAHAKYFNNVARGVDAYLALFQSKGDLGIQKIYTGNTHISFFGISVSKGPMKAGDTFTLSMEYKSDVDYNDVDIDTVIMNANEPVIYFQATNKAYNTRINLCKGTHKFSVAIKDIPINRSMARFSIVIWSKDRKEILFWWRIYVEFEGVDYATGKNFLNVSYETI